MARVLTLQEAQALPPGQLKNWAYNTLDVTGTREVFDTLHTHLTPPTDRIYRVEMAYQKPAMSMMLRGVRVNTILRADMVKELRHELKKDHANIAKSDIIKKVWDGTELETGMCPANFGKRHKWPKGVPDAERSCERCGAKRIKPKPFNPDSDDQTAHLFYELLQLPPMTNKKGKVSADKEVLQRLKNKYPAFQPLIEAILDVRDKNKQLGTLSARLTPDNRYPSSFNIGAAWTGRQSSSKNPFGLGGNLQNIAERHRKTFQADPGYAIAYADYMQGESNLVAHLSGDEKYIEAHKLGDVHTYVTRYVWPQLPWTGDLKKDKLIAKQNPPWDTAPGHDYRFQCKRIQHGSNYGLTPFGISMIAKIPLSEAKFAYNNYMSEFDRILAWQNWVANEVREHRPLVNPMGREVTLFGRPWDPHTVKQALAFLPQSALADIMNIAMHDIWLELEPEGLELFAQIHDALLGQALEDNLQLFNRMLELMKVEVPVTDFKGKTRIMVIGVEAEVGKNWGHANDANPNGLKGFHG